MKTSGTGISFLGLLQIVFIVLKLCGVISWSWVWVFAPLWIPTAIVLGIIVTLFIISITIGIIGSFLGK